MTEQENTGTNEASETSERLVLRAKEPEEQDTLVAAIDEILLEMPGTGSEPTLAKEIDLAAIEQVSPNAFSNYVIASVLTNAFAIGEIGADDRFFLVGAPPEPGTPQAILSGVLCDANGKMLCRIERNTLTANPGECEIIRTNHLGFKVRDANGAMLLHVETRRRDVPRIGESFITTLAGSCVPSVDREYAAFGFNDSGLTRHLGLDGLQQILATATMAASGKLYEPLHGRIENQTLHLDGKLITDGTHIAHCRLVIETGDFVVVPGAQFSISNNELDIRGKARNVAILVAGVPR
jgi:hypothetical protein